MSDYRAEVGEMLNAQTQTETSRKFEMADLVAQQLSGESYHPVADGMTAEREIQAAMDTENKQTQTPLLREEEELKQLTDENRQMELALREKGTQQQKMQEILCQGHTRRDHANSSTRSPIPRFVSKLLAKALEAVARFTPRSHSLQAKQVQTSTGPLTSKLSGRIVKARTRGSDSRSRRRESSMTPGIKSKRR
jgi:hypothetical protein